MGTFSFLGAPEAAEIAALSGFDVVIVDLEHGSRDWSAVLAALLAVRSRGSLLWVRVPKEDPTTMLQALELGCDGILTPFVESAEDVRRVVDLVRFPPVGRRGVCRLTRAAGYGGTLGSFQHHVRAEDARVSIIGLIESVTGANNIQEICDVSPGLDGFVVGRGDLAASLGRPGATDDSEVTQLAEHVLASGSAAEVRGVFVLDPQEAGRWTRLGANLVLCGADVTVLRAGYESARRALDQITNAG